MANNDRGSIEVHFTDDHYATKQEVQKKLQISNADVFWNRILEYRSAFTQELSLKMLTREKLKICITPKIADRINAASMALMKASKRFNNLNAKDRTDEMVRDKQEAQILKIIAKRYNVNVDDGFINNVIRDNVSALFTEKLVLVHYHNIIHKLEDATLQPLDEDYLGELYKTINGGAELSEFYRHEEINDPRQTAQVGHVYIHAPVARIEDMMAELFTYTTESNDALFVKLTAISFFFNYIKPFTYFSEELSIAYLKAFLAAEGYDDIAPYLALEVLLENDNEALETANYNVKKSSDLTYLLDYLLEVFDQIIADFNDTIIKAEKDILVDEYYGLQQESKIVPEIKVTEPLEEKVTAPMSPTLPEAKPIVKDEQETIIAPVEEISPLQEAELEAKLETPVHETLPPLEEAIEEKKIEPPSLPKIDETLSPESGIVNSPQIAITNVPVGLSEEDAERLSEHLLELNPTLKVGEAYFYARHCTIGKYYTIRQYKDTMGVAYETARTSMDHLADQGYYRKEQYKNKYIYTPIARR